MNLRQCITRKVTYSKVTLLSAEGEKTYTVYGETTAAKELKKLLKNNDIKEVPTIKIEVITEQRAITLENFLNNSTVINEEE